MLPVLVFLTSLLLSILVALSPLPDPRPLIALSKQTGMTVDDIVTTLQDMDMIYQNEDGNYVIELDREKMEQHFAKVNDKNYPRAKASCLHWTPFVLSQR